MKEQNNSKNNLYISKLYINAFLISICLLILYSSFAVKTENTAYLFPQIISTTLLIIIASYIFESWHEKIKIKFDLQQITLFLPGFLLIILFIWVAIYLGLLLSSWLFMILIVQIYSRTFDDIATVQTDKRLVRTPYSLKIKSPYLIKVLIIDVFFVTVFMIAIYLLFVVLLKVQIPMGIFDDF